MKKILAVTSSIDETVDYIMAKYNDGIDFFRLNVDCLEEYNIMITAGYWSIESAFGKVSSRDVDSIYYRKPILPQLYGFRDESIMMIQQDIVALINGLVDSFSGKVLSKPYLLRKSENKIFQLLSALPDGVIMPESCITNNYCNIRKYFCKESVIKPMSTGRIKTREHTKIYHTSKLKSFYTDLGCLPIYIQEYIDKKYEIRLTIIDKSYFAVKIDPYNQVDWRIDIEKNRYEVAQCPSKILKLCNNILKQNNLLFGAFDFIVNNKEEWIFLEFNPNGQWLWLEKKLNLNISKKIIDYLVD